MEMYKPRQLMNCLRMSCCCLCFSNRLRPNLFRAASTAIVAAQRNRGIIKSLFIHNSTSSKAKLSPSTTIRGLHSDASFERICNLTLDALAEFLESLADEGICHDDFDIQLASGVLTIKIGSDVGTYVINKQTPNQQIWLSSPLSGPKRYDLVDNCRWIYSHNGVEMNELLSKEFTQIFKRKIDPSDLAYDVDAVG